MARDLYAFGARSAETAALQRALAGLGLYADEIDGIFGRNTLAAVAAARTRFGLGAGEVDLPLRVALGLSPPPGPTPAGRALMLVLPLLLPRLKGLIPMTFLAGYRTYIIATFMLLAGIAGCLGVDIPNLTGQAPGNLVMEALAFFFLRHGLKLDGGK